MRETEIAAGYYRENVGRETCAQTTDRDPKGDSLELDEFNSFCGELTATTHVIQWGDAHVWKVGGKVFAIGGWGENDQLGITFKTTPEEFDFLIEMPGVRPAPYLASRGFTWVQDYDEPGLSDEDLREQLLESHRLVGLGLSKKRQHELGLAAELD